MMVVLIREEAEKLKSIDSIEIWMIVQMQFGV